MPSHVPTRLDFINSPYPDPIPPYYGHFFFSNILRMVDSSSKRSSQRSVSQNKSYADMTGGSGSEAEDVTPLRASHCDNVGNKRKRASQRLLIAHQELIFRPSQRQSSRSPNQSSETKNLKLTVLSTLEFEKYGVDHFWSIEYIGKDTTRTKILGPQRINLMMMIHLFLVSSRNTRRNQVQRTWEGKQKPSQHQKGHLLL
jgi:hypothetical protein